jgi:hypothetical protein
MPEYMALCGFDPAAERARREMESKVRKVRLDALEATRRRLNLSRAQFIGLTMDELAAGVKAATGKEPERGPLAQGVRDYRDEFGGN